MAMFQKLKRQPSKQAAATRGPTVATAPHATTDTTETTPIGQIQWRQRVRVAGRVRSLRVQPWSGVATLECILLDDSGGVSVVFLGRRKVAGIHPGTRMTVEGMVGAHSGRLAIINPDYELEEQS